MGRISGFICHEKSGITSPVDLVWDVVGAIGFSIRDKGLLEKHIKELSELGVFPPQKTPEVYWLSPNIVIDGIERLYVVGEETSGEVEVFCAFDKNGEMYITVGSDHTDRSLERHNIRKSKQICGKPVANTCWRFNEIKDHIDDLRLVCEVKMEDSDQFILYQEGELGYLKPLVELKNLLEKDFFIRENNFKFSFFSGTIPALREITSASTYKMKLIDNFIGREIELRYEVVVLE